MNQTKPDKFGKFEIRIIEWWKKHLYILVVFTILFVMISMMALEVTLITGSVGMALVDQNMTERYQAGMIGEQQMHSWTTLVLPGVIFLFNWQCALIRIISIGYLSGILYFGIREVTRLQKKESVDMIIPAEIIKLQERKT